MKINEITTATGQELPAASYCYKQSFRGEYNPATDYRIFIRGVDDETRRVEYSFFNSYDNDASADSARFALRKDQAKYLFVCPGDEDPAGFGICSQREQREIIAADRAQMEREG